MNININATNMELTPAIRAYVENKIGNLEKFVSSHGDNAQVQVEVGKTTQHHQKGDVFRAEINISLSGNSYQFRAESETDNLYAAIDLAKDELERELIRFKGKRETIYRRGAKTLKSLIKRFWE